MGRSAKKALAEASRSQVGPSQSQGPNQGPSQGPSQSPSQGPCQGPSQSKENITWAGTLDTLLAFQMKEEHHE